MMNNSFENPAEEASEAYVRAKKLLSTELDQCKSTDELVEQFKALMRQVEERVIASIYQFREQEVKNRETTRTQLIEMQKELDRLHSAYEAEKKPWREGSMKAVCEVIEKQLVSAQRNQARVELNTSKVTEAIKSAILKNAQGDNQEREEQIPRLRNRERAQGQRGFGYGGYHQYGGYGGYGYYGGYRDYMRNNERGNGRGNQDERGRDEPDRRQQWGGVRVQRQMSMQSVD